MSDHNRHSATLDQIRSMVGTEVGASRWFAMPQSRIDAFADCTEDWYFIHTNPEKAEAETPWGGTIAHGFLTASLMSAMAYDVVPRCTDAVHGVNYGFDKLRFVSPVPSGSNVRGRFELLEANTDKPGEVTCRYNVAIEIEGQEIAGGGRPAIVATWLTRQFLG